jgi:hypothetical protein
MPRVSLRLLWLSLSLPALLFVVFLLAFLTWDQGGGVCSGHPGQQVTTLGSHCVLLVPGR